MIRKRVQQRKNTMIQIIKRAVIKYDPRLIEIFHFDIPQTLLKILTNRIIYILEKWDGGKGYKSAIINYETAHKKTRTYWNREKPLPLGDELFIHILGALFKVKFIFYLHHLLSLFLSHTLSALCWIFLINKYSSNSLTLLSKAVNHVNRTKQSLQHNY